MCEQVSAGDVNSGILRAKDELQALKLCFFFFFPSYNGQTFKLHPCLKAASQRGSH